MRVLQVFGEPLSFGGQEAFIMNIYEAIDKSKIQFDFFTPYYCNNNNMKKKIEMLGGSVYACNRKFESKKRKKYFVNELETFLSKQKYDIVHINSCSTFALAYGAKIAKQYNAIKVIVHSHSKGLLSLKYLVVKLLSNNKLKKYADVYLACSDEAARWKFPGQIINEKKYSVIKNGINVEKYLFNNEIRREYRRKFGIDDRTFVLGHIGRMELEKNHFFVIDVFSKLKNKNDDSKLILIGNGSLEDKIKEKIKNLNLTESIIILKNRNDVNKILQSMDSFIFPSLYEGLGMAAIEAQAAGLKVFVSENIPEIANVTDNFIKLNLASGSEYWANRILTEHNKEYRKNTKNELYKHGYDICESVSNLEKIYFE